MNLLTKYMQLLIMSVFISACSHSIAPKSNNKHPLLPSTCLDPSGHYQPISHLKTITTLNSNASNYSPVNAPKGIIKADFNTDKQKDYIFVESLTTVNRVKARLVVCLSDRNNHIRKLPEFPIHSNTQPDFQSIHERIEWKNNQLTLSVFKSEHNWGSDEDIKHYRYDKQQLDFILVSQELVSTSGDGLRSDTYDFYNFDKRSYKSNSSCGSLEQGCKNTKASGRLVLPKQRAGLFKPTTKTYLHKIPKP